MVIHSIFSDHSSSFYKQAEYINTQANQWDILPFFLLTISDLCDICENKAIEQFLVKDTNTLLL